MSFHHTISSVGRIVPDANVRRPDSPALTRRRHVDMMLVCSAGCPAGARR